jgi:hypothetical protein
MTDMPTISRSFSTAFRISAKAIAGKKRSSPGKLHTEVTHVCSRKVVRAEGDAGKSDGPSPVTDSGRADTATTMDSGLGDAGTTCGDPGQPCCSGMTCVGATSCISAVCTCPDGSTGCGAACVDEQTDDHNCGGCGLTSWRPRLRMSRRRWALIRQRATPNASKSSSPSPRTGTHLRSTTFSPGSRVSRAHCPSFLRLPIFVLVTKPGYWST